MARAHTTPRDTPLGDEGTYRGVRCAGTIERLNYVTRMADGIAVAIIRRSEKHD